MSHTTLIPVEALAAALGRPDWVVLDCRHDLTDIQAGRRAYGVSHIPGARFAHVDEDLSGAKNGRNGRHPLPEPVAFARWMAALGVTNRSQVVAYDASGGAYAARLWWMLRWAGHDAVAVLDGGWEAWLAAGHPVTAGIPAASPGSFVPAWRTGLALDVAAVGAASAAGLAGSRLYPGSWSEWCSDRSRPVATGSAS